MRACIISDSLSGFSCEAEPETRELALDKLEQVEANKHPHNNRQPEALRVASRLEKPNLQACCNQVLFTGHSGETPEFNLKTSFL